STSPVPAADTPLSSDSPPYHDGGSRQPPGNEIETELEPPAARRPREKPLSRRYAPAAVLRCGELQLAASLAAKETPVLPKESGHAAPHRRVFQIEAGRAGHAREFARLPRADRKVVNPPALRRPNDEVPVLEDFESLVVPSHAFPERPQERRPRRVDVVAQNHSLEPKRDRHIARLHPAAVGREGRVAHPG